MTPVLNEMGEFTVSNLITVLGWIIAPVFGFLFSWAQNKYHNAKKQKEDLKKEYDADRLTMREALKCLLRETLKSEYHRRFDSCSAEKGYCPLEVKEEIDEVYQIYADLGGNHSAKRLYNELMSLPVERPE